MWLRKREGEGERGREREPQRQCVEKVSVNPCCFFLLILSEFISKSLSFTIKREDTQACVFTLIDTVPVTLCVRCFCFILFYIRIYIFFSFSIHSFPPPRSPYSQTFPNISSSQNKTLQKLLFTSKTNRVYVLWTNMRPGIHKNI